MDRDDSIYEHQLSTDSASLCDFIISNLSTQIHSQNNSILTMYPQAITNIILLLSSFALAAWDGIDGKAARTKCISDREAALLVSNFESLFVSVDPVVAKGILAADFREYSDSLNWLLPPAQANYRVRSPEFLPPGLESLQGITLRCQ